jgi:hypothetical protein
METIYLKSLTGRMMIWRGVCSLTAHALTRHMELTEPLASGSHRLAASFDNTAIFTFFPFCEI